jgi:hypothetical protein
VKPLARDYHIADRRRRVAALVLRGLSQREITRAQRCSWSPMLTKRWEFAPMSPSRHLLRRCCEAGCSRSQRKLSILSQ